MKIDLEEINGIIADIMLDYDEAVMDNEDLAAKSWGYETGQIFSHEKAKKIADALGQLPRLFEALQNMNGCYNTPIQRRKANTQQLEAIKITSEALEPFTTKADEENLFKALTNPRITVLFSVTEPFTTKTQP